MSKLSKPTLGSAALSFAEAKPASQTGYQPRVFHAPEGYKRLTINVPAELHKRLKIIAIERETTATDILMGLLEKELASKS